MAITVFVNERAVSVDVGMTLEDAVSAVDAQLGAAIVSERAYVTDGVGRRLANTSLVFGGAIYRVVLSGERREESAGA